MFSSTCFKAVTQIESDFNNLASQNRSWYDVESFGAYKLVDPRSACVARGQKTSDDTTYHDGCQYHVGMLCADHRRSLPENYFSVQLNSRERRLVKNPEQKTSYSQTITNDFEKSYFFKIDKEDCSKNDCPPEWYLLHHPVFQASTNVLYKTKGKNFISDLVPSEPEKQKQMAITAVVTKNASTFVWRRYRSCEKLLRVVAYMSRSLPKFARSWTKTAWNTDPSEYVPSLNRRTKWSSTSNRDLKTVNFVQRADYLLARLVKLNFGSDAIATSAEVRTTSGNLFRPCSNLPLFFLFPIPKKK